MKQTCVKCKNTFFFHRQYPFCESCSPPSSYENSSQLWAEWRGGKWEPYYHRVRTEWKLVEAQQGWRPWQQ